MRPGADLLQSHEEQMALLKQVRGPDTRPSLPAPRQRGRRCRSAPPNPGAEAGRPRRAAAGPHRHIRKTIRAVPLAQASELLQGYVASTNPGAQDLLQSHDQQMQLLKKVRPVLGQGGGGWGWGLASEAPYICTLALAHTHNAGAHGQRMQLLKKGKPVLG